MLPLTQEEKERAFEKDYERFCPKFARDADIEDDELQRITVKSLVGVFQVTTRLDIANMSGMSSGAFAGR